MRHPDFSRAYRRGARSRRYINPDVDEARPVVPKVLHCLPGESRHPVTHGRQQVRIALRAQQGLLVKKDKLAQAGIYLRNALVCSHCASWRLSSGGTPGPRAAQDEARA